MGKVRSLRLKMETSLTCRRNALAIVLVAKMDSQTHSLGEFQQEGKGRWASFIKEKPWGRPGIKEETQSMSTEQGGHSGAKNKRTETS